MFKWINNIFNVNSSEKPITSNQSNKLKQGSSKTLAMPNNICKLYDPKVEEIIKRSLTTSYRIHQKDIDSGKFTEDEVRIFGFSNFCQDTGARLVRALRSEDLKEATNQVNILTTLMELVEGGNICAIHEPFLMEYVKRVNDLYGKKLVELTKKK